MAPFLQYIWNKHKRTAVKLCILGILSSITSIIMSWSLKYSVDFLFGVENKYVLIAVALFALMAITTYLSDQVGENYFVSKYQSQFVHDLKRALIDSYEKLPYEKAREYSSGELMNRDTIVNDIGDIYISTVYYLPYCVLESLGFFVFIGAFISWKIDIILFILIPFALLLKKIVNEMRKTNGEINRKKAVSHNFFLDTLSKIDFIKANGIVGSIECKYKQKNDDIIRLQKKLYAQNYILSFWQFLLENIIKFMVPVIATFMMLNGDITPGGVAVSSTIFSSFLVPSLFQMIGLTKEIGGAQEIISEIMQNIAIKDEKPVYRREEMQENVLIKLEKVTYISRKRELLKNMSMVLPEKGCIGISGASGEGKSTFARITAGLLKPEKGKVIYNSLYFKKEDVCQNIAYFNNDGFFMEDSVIENIKAGGDNWKEAIKIPEVDLFISQLENKQNTELTENARNLSGGQRQLLGIARAAAKENASIIIFDEPTSSLDEKSQRNIWEFIKKLSTEKCVLVITHQTELLNQIERKYQLKDGHLYKV